MKKPLEFEDVVLKVPIDELVGDRWWCRDDL